MLSQKEENTFIALADKLG